MSEKNNKIVFTTQENEKVEFIVVEQTKLNGINYLLVTEDSLENDDTEAEAYILKDVSAKEDDEAIYDMLEDENELEVIGKIFSELLEDIDLV